MNPERLTDARHEAGHATAAHLLGRRVILLSVEEEPFGSPCMEDRFPMEPLGHRHHPDAQWVNACDDVIITLAGPLCADQEPAGLDLWQVEQILATVTDSEEEHEALSTALRLRCEGMVKHPHFRAIHEHMTVALLREGVMRAPVIRNELERAQFRYVNKPIDMETHTNGSSRN